MKVRVLKIVDNKTFKGSSSAYKKHSKYGKYVTTNKNYLIHCSDSSLLSIGSEVNIKESRPFSKRKSWVVV